MLRQRNAAASTSPPNPDAGPLVLSDVFQAADRRAISAQRNFLRMRLLELSLLVAAAIVDGLPVPDGRFPSSTVLPLVGSGLFLLAGLLETNVVTTTPERSWYAARALAESARTLAWRFAVGGLPFPLDSSDADRTFLRRLQEVAGQFPELSILPDSSPKSVEITPWMASLRASPLPDRTAAYLQLRIEDQRRWYASKSRWNRNRASLWSAGILLIQFSGIAAGCLSAVFRRSFDALPIIAAIAASVVAWLQIKQHATLAESYSVTAMELSDVLASAPTPNDEEAWAQFVDKSENAMSREHTLWRAKRG